MRQAYLSEPGARLTFRDVPVPEPGPRDALLRVTVSTVCTLTDLGVIAGSHPPHDAGVAGMLPHDLRLRLGRSLADPLRHSYPSEPFGEQPFPTTMGHEAAGTVAALGAEANEPDALVFPDQPLAVGDRVATFRVPGAYGEYAALPTANVVRIPPYMNNDEGSLIEPLITNYNTVKRCFGYGRPRTVLVVGQGCQGLMATQCARALGAEWIAVSEPCASRRELARELGADVAIDPTAVHVVDEVARLTGGRGVDLLAECVGAEETIRAAPYVIRRGGMLAQIGAFTNPVTFDYGYVHFRRFLVVPADAFTTLRDRAVELRELLGLIRDGQVLLRPLVTHRFALDDLNDAYDLLRRGEDGVLKVAIDVAPNGGPPVASSLVRRATAGRVGWGVLGPGRVGREHFIPALSGSANGRRGGVGARSLDRARSAVAAAGEGRACGSYGELLADPDVQAVYVSLPSSMHVEWTLAALAAGKDVLCEKPLALSLAELDAVEHAAAAAGSVVMEAFRYRFRSLYEPGSWERVLEAVGTPRAAHTHASLTLDDPTDFRADSARGGGALWDIGCYCLSVIEWLFGAPDSLQAVGRERGGVDWSATVAMRWESGLEATAWWSFAAVRSQRLTLVGDRGVLDLFDPFWERSGPAGRLQVGADVEELAPPPENSFRREVEQFTTAVRREAAPAVTLGDTRGWLAVAERVRDALAA